MTRLVVGAHLDDATLSCGAWLSVDPQPVLTVCAGLPPEGSLTPYDEACGFSDSHLAMGARHAEDEAAMSVLGVTQVVRLPWLDRQYRGFRERLPLAEVAESIHEQMTALGCDGIVGPLAVNHPDHLDVSNACLHLAREGVPTFLYSDLPNRVVWAEHAAGRSHELAFRGWTLVPDQPVEFDGNTDEALAVKERAIGCYASQKVDIHCCLVPERYWAVR